MPEIVGVRFRSCGKIYDFEAEGMELKPGDLVVVESEMGLSIGSVVKKGPPDEEQKELKKVLRLVSEEDLKESESNQNVKKEAFEFCKERIMARGLQMKLIRTDTTLDRKRIIFYFVSEKRIDFRELVKDLAQKFRTRIEMRQVGVRDEAKFTGGIGICGRPLCCSSFLVDFAPISIKMAKKQELVLNTGKLSGCCGRLMCCLSYEYQERSYAKEVEGHEEENGMVLKDEPEGAQVQIEEPDSAGEEAPKEIPSPDISAEVNRQEERKQETVQGQGPINPPGQIQARGGQEQRPAEQGSQSEGEQRGKRKKRRWRKRGRPKPKPST